jgi:CRISPR/Cas system CSM-associated protein Csm3 (group 7 of RAMP superfamily)
MFARRLNELIVTLRLTPASPLLIKDGRHHEHGDKSRKSFHCTARRQPEQKCDNDNGHLTDEYDVNMACVYSKTKDQQPDSYQFYIPGSSLRGVLRATAERIVGRWRPDLVDDPASEIGQQFAGTDKAILQAEQDDPLYERPNSVKMYHQTKPVERCFGHSLLRGRWTIDDAWIASESVVVVRDGVGINRITGAAQDQLKFRFEAIAQGEFRTTIRLVNFECWQPGLLAYVLAELDSGNALLGSAGRRGLGRVRIAVEKMVWRWWGYTPQEGTDTDGKSGIIMPPLSYLARRINPLDDYGWQEPADIQVIIPCESQQLRPTMIGSELQIKDGLCSDATGDTPFAPTNWDDPLWAKLAAGLPDALKQWKTEEQAQ